METVVVDTNVLSYQFKSSAYSLAYVPLLENRLCYVSFMTVAELELWTLERKWGQKRRSRLAEFLKQFAVLPYDPRLCRWWAEVTHTADRRGRPIKCSDAWIAATALAMDIPLVMHNPGDFNGVDGLKVLTAD